MAQAAEGSEHGSERETVELFPGNRVDFLKTCLCSYGPTNVPESGLVYFLGWFPGNNCSCHIHSVVDYFMVEQL